MIRQKNRSIKIIAGALVLATIGSVFCAVAEITQVEQRVAEQGPVLFEKLPTEEKPEYKEKIYIHSFYEYNFVKQRGKGHGEWQVLTSRIAYLNNGVQQPYVDVNYYKRFADEELTLEAGSYFKFQDGYIHPYGGFGRMDNEGPPFMYNWKGGLEVEHKLFDTVYLNVEGTYLNKLPDDVYVLTPGLVYYFGDHYISADYGLTLIVTRGWGQFGTVRGNFVITKHITFFGGGAVGEWLYDIFGLPPQKEKGYLFFTGLNVNVTDNIMLRVSVSWAHEDPQFEKTGINSGLAIKF
jgi:YaiO family outer membrane protein